MTNEPHPSQTMNRRLLADVAARLRFVAAQLERAADDGPDSAPAGTYWLSNDGERLTECASMNEALLDATWAIEPDGEWCEGIEDAGWGIFVYVDRAQAVSREPDPSGEWDEIVEYALEPCATEE